MTATDELRKMLDERGVEWGTGFGGDTFWTGRHGIEWRWDKQEGALAMWTHAITPEQAIEATLGRGTCRRVLYKPTNVLVCSECGAGMPKQLDRYCFLHFCPNCGRKVVED